MSRPLTRVWSLAVALAALLAAMPASGLAQAPPPARESPPSTRPPQPFGPDWAMLAGWSAFSSKGCGKCHALRGVGPQIGPDLGRMPSAQSFFDIGAAMWNHLPRMSARMKEAGVERASLTPAEAANLIAFIFTAQYFDESGDARRGEQVFSAKGCVQCHAVGGTGGKVGPPLDRYKRANSPVLVAAAMWNHAAKMAEAMKAKGIARPMLSGQELLDLIAYIVATGVDTSGETQQVVPGTPDRGRQLFADKHCSTCHAVGGQGGHVGPDLGRAGHRISLTQFAARMWDHAPKMSERARERGFEVPTLSGQEMADILAYLYVSHYFDPNTSPQRGQELVRVRGCLGCHSVRGKGGTVAADFATSTVVRSPAGLIAGMWNHGRLMEAQAERRQTSWPVLTGQELGDVSAYLASLGRTAPAPAKKP